MSQFPDPNNPFNPPAPLPYAQSYAPPKLRPTSVTVLAILGIIFGSLAILGSFCNTLELTGVSPDADNPLVKGMQDDHTLFVWSVIGVVVDMALGLLLLGGSIKAWSLKRSGRSWLIAYSWLDIAFTLISTGIGFVLVLPKLDQIIQNSNQNASMRSIMQMSTWGGFLFSVVLLAYPALILYYMSRPNVKEAFQRGMVAPAVQWGVGPPPSPGNSYPPPPGGPGTY